MELGQYLNTIWKWIWLIVLAAAVAAVSSFYAVSQAPRVYQTKTTLMVGQFIRDPDPNTTDFWTSQQLAQTYVQLVGREPILQGSLDALNLSDQMDWRTVSGMVRASLVAGTQLMEIFVTDTNPERAKVLADTIAQQLILQSPANAASDEDDRRAFAAGQLIDLEGKIEGAEIELKELQTELDEAISARRIQDLQTQINTLQGKVSAWQSSYAQFLLFLEGGQVNYLTVVEPALVPTSPISPNVMMNILLAVGIAVTLAVGAAFLLEYMDDTVKTPADIQRTVSLPTLGAIARMEDELPGDLPIAVRTPRAPIVEPFRSLRTNIQFSAIGKPIRKIAITSSNPVEGKSTTVANLAVVLAQSGLSTTLVDTDLRRPVLHRKFDLLNAGSVGLTTALLEMKLVDLLAPGETGYDSSNVVSYLQDATENLRVMTSGPIPPNPAELLGSARMKRLISALEAESDMILFDTPPVLAVTDAAVIAAQVDGVVLIVDAGRTRRSMLKRAVDELQRIGTPILGVVLNRLTSRRGGYYYYYYNHYYSSDGRGRGDGRKGSRRRPLAERLPFVRLFTANSDRRKQRVEDDR